MDKRHLQMRITEVFTEKPGNWVILAKLDDTNPPAQSVRRPSVQQPTHVRIALQATFRDVVLDLLGQSGHSSTARLQQVQPGDKFEMTLVGHKTGQYVQQATIAPSASEFLTAPEIDLLELGRWKNCELLY